MTQAAVASGDAARALALLQQLTAMCDETTRVLPNDPSRISAMLESFEETLALLAPVLEVVGKSPSESRDTVIAAALHAADRHQALLDAISRELDRLSHAIASINVASQVTAAYAGGSPVTMRAVFQANG